MPEPALSQVYVQWRDLSFPMLPVQTVPGQETMPDGTVDTEDVMAIRHHDLTMH